MDWLRLWHDMPNDPKWRTIARQSKQPIALVQALYIHLLVDASKSETRGNADVTVEDLASALDVDDEQIEAILEAMQGRVIDGRSITGWEKRQPKRNDDSKDRVRRYREKKASESDNNGGPDGPDGNGKTETSNDSNGDVTQGNAPEEIRGEESRGDNHKNTGPANAEPASDSGKAKKFTEDDFEKFWKFCRDHWFGRVGTKADAKDAFKKLKPETDDLREILKLTRQECEYRRRVEAAEGFCESMKHVCRWIKVRGWEDVKERIEAGPALSLVASQDSTQVNRPHRPPMPRPDRAPQRPTGTGGDA